MSLDVKVKTSLLVEFTVNEAKGLGYELFFIGLDQKELAEFVKIFSIKSGANIISEVLPIFKHEAEKLGLEYREKVLANRRGLDYLLMKWAMQLHHWEFRRLGEFKYRLNHKIERVYE